MTADIRKLPSLVERGPHLYGEAVCLQCGNEWVSVAPVGVMELECPSCHTMKAVFKYGCEPDGDAWVCNCGCYLFMLSGESERMICWKCGSYQEGF